MKEFLLGVLGFCTVVAGITIAFANKFSKKLYDTKEVDILKMEDVIIFFKKKEILDKLKSNNNFLAVAIKENKKDYYQILCAIYDKSKEKVLDIDNCALIFKAKDIDIDLKNAFGDKDMIVLN